MSGNQSSYICFFLTYNLQEIDNGKTVYLTSCVLAALCILPSIALNACLIRSRCGSANLKKPSTVLLHNLSLSNLLMGLILQPVYLVKKIAELDNNFPLYCIMGTYTYIVGFILATVSLFTVTAIAVDRYFIVHSGVEYSLIITQRRIVITVTFIWIIAIILSTGQLYLPRSATFPAAGIGMGICVTITTASYIQILKTIRQKKAASLALNERAASNSANVMRYIKTSITMMLVCVVFIICYVPYLSTMIVGAVLGESFNGIGSAESLATVITYIKCWINPLILFWRIQEIQTSARTMIPRWLLRSRVSDSSTNIWDEQFKQDTTYKLAQEQ